MLRLLFLSFLVLQGISAGPEEDEGVIYANKCEVCKVVALELETRLNETGKSHDVLEMGYSLDDVKPKKKKEYKKSELRLVESLENVCDKILEYNIHKERKDSTRFARGMSETFQTLHGLVDRGVKVDLGMPYELWDKPSAEVTHLKTQCEDLLEAHESDIDDWYFNLQGQVSLASHLCEQKALANEDASCLQDKPPVKKPTEKTKDKKDKKQKKEKKEKKEKKDTEEKKSDDKSNEVKTEL